MAIFIADMTLPLGIAFGNLYIGCILLVMREGRKPIMIITAIGCALTLLKVGIYYDKYSEFYFLINRFTTVFTLIVMAIITTRLSIFQERQKLMEELDRKQKESEQFLYIASHDLNEPVRTIKVMAEMLDKRHSHVLNDEGRQFTQFIHGAAERMSALIRSLLDYGRIGKDSSRKPADISKIADQAIKNLACPIAESGAAFEVAPLGVMPVYETELLQLFQNLFSNAIKFKREGVPPKIAVTSHQIPGYRQFCVRDNGIGILPQHLEKIFAMFRKLHSPQDIEGTGIGLAHCRKIAELHGGRIWAESLPGEGSSFYFTIPDN